MAEWVVCFHLHHCTCQSVSATNQNANMTAESPSHPMISPTVMGSNPLMMIGKWNSLSGTVLKLRSLLVLIPLFTQQLYEIGIIIIPILKIRKVRVIS